MNKINHSLSVFLTIILLSISCNSNNKSSTSAFYSDTTKYKVDTILENVNIGGEQFSIKLLRDKLNDHLEKYTQDGDLPFSQSPLTVAITNVNNSNLNANKKLDSENSDLYYLFYKGQRQTLAEQGKLYFKLTESAGGSGYSTITYFINMND